MTPTARPCCEKDDEEDGPSASEDTSHCDRSGESEQRHCHISISSTRETFTGGGPGRGGTHNGGGSLGRRLRADRQGIEAEFAPSRNVAEVRAEPPARAVRHGSGCGQPPRAGVYRTT